MNIEENTGKRPLFLTILCVLSYAGIALQLIKNSYVLLYDFNLDQTMQDVDATVNVESSSISGVLAFQQYAGWMGMIGIICALLCFRGVRMMWQLRKNGFFIYSAGEIIPLIAGMILMGPSMYFNGYMASFMFALPLCFIALYLTTVRHMS
ncbi:MAG: hypothetical protein V2A54_10330 [Bacteroidota bacterium]